MTTTLSGTSITTPAASIGTVKQVAQFLTFQTGAVATTTAILPRDDTIPQITEGAEFMTLAIIPQNVASSLEIEVVFNASVAAADSLTVALFQDANVNALATSCLYYSTASALGQITFKHIVPAGTITSTTFRVRAGANTAITTTFNGITGGRQFGGVMASRITIKEYLP